MTLFGIVTEKNPSLPAASVLPLHLTKAQEAAEITIVETHLLCFTLPRSFHKQGICFQLTRLRRAKSDTVLTNKKLNL